MARLNSRNVPLKRISRYIQRLSRYAILRVARPFLLALFAARRQFRSSRYYTRPRRYTVRNTYFDKVPKVLQLPAKGYFQAFRMSKEDLRSLADQLATDDVFRRRGNKPQAPVLYQVALVVYRLCHVVETAALASIFKCSMGSVTHWTDRVLQAFLRRQSTYMPWPSAVERVTIRQHFETFGLPECVGVIDGCKINLLNAPHRPDKAAYHTYKERYALVCLFVVDHTYRIRYIHYGYPGSANDKRVQRLCTLLNEPENFFSSGEYILGDAGFTCGDHIVPLYHKSAKKNAHSDRREAFNKAAAKARVVVEQAIGILKGRFPALRTLNLTLKTPRDEARAHGLINTAYSTFDLAMDNGINDDDDVDDVGDGGGGPGNGGGSGAVPVNQLRREEVCSKLLELLSDN